jgi:hypothetical protein
MRWKNYFIFHLKITLMLQESEPDIIYICLFATNCKKSHSANYKTILKDVIKTDWNFCSKEILVFHIICFV